MTLESQKKKWAYPKEKPGLFCTSDPPLKTLYLPSLPQHVPSTRATLVPGLTPRSSHFFCLAAFPAPCYSSLGKPPPSLATSDPTSSTNLSWPLASPQPILPGSALSPSDGGLLCAVSPLCFRSSHLASSKTTYWQSWILHSQVNTPQWKWGLLGQVSLSLRNEAL